MMNKIDRTAANDGDRLKHALLIESLVAARDWPFINYVETHAGNGINSATAQTRHHHIRSLRALVTSADVTKAGGAYLRLLRKWWRVERNAETYPGSVLLATRYLMQHRRRRWCARVTENDEASFERLTLTCKASALKAKLAPFTQELEWLTERDNLIILVDPWACLSRLKRADDRDSGHIDLSLLNRILNRCAERHRAVLHLWTSFAHGFGVNRSEVYRTIERWCERQGSATCVHYCTRKNQSHSVIGISEGVQVVNRMPMKLDWRTSWLRDVVRVPRAKPRLHARVKWTSKSST